MQPDDFDEPQPPSVADESAGPTPWFNEPMPASPESGPLPAGTAVGRFEVREVLGRGGMGILYRAHDPHLGRAVALKLVRSDRRGESGAGMRERLVREAQALARLSHPNVVAIYEAGSFGDDVYIALELIEGRTVREWIKAERPGVSAILEVFLAAGEGLAAAHAAGLIHRDFKPDNVLIGHDGRVRVVDFGLARALDDTARKSASWPPSLPAPALAVLRDPPPRDEPLRASARSAPLLPPEVSTSSGPTVVSGSGPALMSHALLEVPLTRVGTIVGTPHYMPLEQHLELPVDARSDQFAFCVALYEALYKELPFEAGSVAELQAALFTFRLRKPRPSRVPRWLRPVITRGLAPDPARRYPTMGALLAALRRNPRRVWTQRGIAAGATLLAAAAVVGVTRGPRSARAVCSGAEGKLAGVWDEPRRAAVAEAFQRTGLPYAADAFRSTAGALDTFAERWTRMHTEACEATHHRGEQSGELLDLRMQCLGQKLEDVRALVDVFMQADAPVVESGVRAALARGNLSRCADATALWSPAALPEGEPIREGIADARRKVSAAEALISAGRYEAGLAAAAGALEAAAATGYKPVEADALVAMGTARFKLAAFDEAKRSLREAVRVGNGARHDEAALRAWALLIDAEGEGRGDFAAAHEHARDAHSALERIGGHDAYRGALLRVEANVYYREGQRDRALALATEAAACLDRAHGPTALEGVDAQVLLGVLAGEQGQHDRARRHHERALASVEATLGARHPAVAAIVMNLGIVTEKQGRRAEAAEQYSRSLQLMEEVLGPEHVQVSFPLVNLANLHVAAGQPSQALPLATRASSLRRAALGPRHPLYASALRAAAGAHARLGDEAEARRAYEEAVSIYDGARNPRVVEPLLGLALLEEGQGALEPARKHLQAALERALAVHGPSTEEIAHIEAALGRHWLHRGQPERARPLLERAVATYEALLGPEHPVLLEPLTAFGEAHLATGRSGDARALLERAVAVGALPWTDPQAAAGARFALARAIVADEGPSAAARALAESARSIWAGAGPRSRRALAAVDRWLSGPGSPRR